MRVRFSMSRGRRPDEHPEGLQFDVEMPAVPRVDDGVIRGVDGENFTVTAVHWTPEDPARDAYVVLR